MTKPDEWALVSYIHANDLTGRQRFVQRAIDPLPKWAVDVKPFAEKEPATMTAAFDLNDPDTIRRARLALGLTQAQLAVALELFGPYGKDTVRAWESGKRPISGPGRAAIRLMLEKAGVRP
jgi:DNA-binding transcriptional regulator YiaG